MKSLAGARVWVVGMARSGRAAAALLLGHGAEVTAVDERPAEELKLHEDPRLACVRLVRQQEADFRGADLIVLSPGVPADLPPLEEARQAGVRVIGELELASWFLKGPTLAITGTNGKSTTTALTGHLLQRSGIPAQIGGNIGTPPTAMVESSREDQWNVLEVSSFQLETTDTFRPAIGAVLNLTPNHLDRHRTFERYAAAKRRLLDNQIATDYAVLNADDPVCVGWAAELQGRVVWFSSSKPVTPGLWLEYDKIWFDGEPVIAVKDIPLRGLHNVENVMAAIACARLAGASLKQIAAAIPSFAGLEHRLEFVREVAGVEYFNDSKATSVDATLKALSAFPGRLWVILGGKDKDSDYTPLIEPLREKARGVLLIGAAANKIAAALGDAVPLIPCGDLRRAVTEAAKRAEAGDTVLLAPACASFDQFESFEHRGQVFKDLVRSL